jgi:hypothetical protein
VRTLPPGVDAARVQIRPADPVAEQDREEIA